MFSSVITNRERHLSVGKKPKHQRFFLFFLARVFYNWLISGSSLKEERNGWGQGGNAWERLKLALLSEDKTMNHGTTL